MQAWKEREIPKDQRTNIIVPIFKKGDQKMEENYWDISPVHSLRYTRKIYAEILRKRLEERIEKIVLLPKNQKGLRRGKGTTDNIFILKYVI